MLAGLLVGLPSIGNDFVYDDHFIVQENPRIRDLTDLRAIFLTDWWKPLEDDEDAILGKKRDRLYRPLTMFTFALNYAAHGLDPRGFHLTNVLMHALVCGLVWRLVLRLFDDPLLAFWSALLFAVHPVHAEAVANVVGRAEILTTLFLLIALLVLLTGRSGPTAARLVASLPLFLAALLCKESTISYVPIALILLFWCYRMSGKRLALAGAGLALPLLIYFPARIAALEGHLIRDRLPGAIANVIVMSEGVERLWLPFDVLGHYARLLVIPQKLCCNYGLAIVDPDAGPGVSTLLGIATAAILVVALLGWRRTEGPWRVIALSATVFLASYVLISNTVLLIGVTLAERLLYWPSVPALVLVTQLGLLVHRRSASTTRRLARLMPTIAGAIVVALGVRMVDRGWDWSSNAALFARDVATFPQCVEANAVHASELLAAIPRLSPEQQAPQAREALTYLDRALSMYPRYASALRTRAVAHAVLGQNEKARRDLETALLIVPNDRKSRRMLNELAATDPTGAPTTQPLANDPLDRAEQLLRATRGEEAVALLEPYVETHPDDPRAVRLLGEAYLATLEYEKALEAMRRAVRLDPDNWLVHTNLVVLLQDEDKQAALEHARRAYQLEPRAVQTNMNFAEALLINGQRSEGRRVLQRLYDALPKDDPFRAIVEKRLKQLRG